MLFIDPHQPAEKVNAMMNIGEIRDVDEMDTDAVLEAFNGCFDFSENTLKQSYFKGTLLRFPLREERSELSENLYSEKKVNDLFEGFETEISSLLLFLKNLESIEICRRFSEKTDVIAKAEIVDEKGLIREKRSFFSKQLQEAVANNTVFDDIECSISMKIRVMANDNVTESSWQIVNYVIGTSASGEFQTLMKDKRLGYSPCVGLAISMDPHTKTEGHVFCFLPLPREGSKVSGLPFHINGFFALSKNRHHLKWATDEQKGKEISDKSILWNERMIKEALPRAYEFLLQTVISMAENAGNDADAVGKVYNLFIDKTDLRDDKWETFANEAFRYLQESHILFCQSACRWISLSEAVFAFFSDEQMHIKSAVKACLAEINSNFVDMQKDKFNALNSYHYDLTVLSPSALATLLSHNSSYTILPSTVKLDILEYLLSGSNSDTIQDLQLLPLASGDWISYNSSESFVYTCTDQELELFPGMEKQFLQTDSRLGRNLTKTLATTIEQGKYKKRLLYLRLITSNKLTLFSPQRQLFRSPH